MKHLKISGKLLEQFKDHQCIYHCTVTWLTSSCVCFLWDIVQVYPYTHTHVTHICTYICMRTHTYQVYILTCICIQHTDVGICTLVCTCTYMYMQYIHTYAYMHIHIYTHLSLYTHQYVLIYMNTSPELNSLKIRSSWISPLKTSGASLKNKDILLHTFIVFIIPKKINNKALISYYI